MLVKIIKNIEMLDSQNIIKTIEMLDSQNMLHINET